MAFLTNHIVGAVLAIGIAAPVIYTVTDREPCARPLTTRVMTPEVRPGDNLVIAYTITRKAACHTVAQRIIFDGADIELAYMPDERTAFGGSGTDTKSVSVQVPSGATPGKARYRLILTFKGNWFQEIAPVVTVQPDLLFTILPPEKENG